jgi:hypothetical protein
VGPLKREWTLQQNGQAVVPLPVNAYPPIPTLITTPHQPLRIPSCWPNGPRPPVRATCPTLVPLRPCPAALPRICHPVRAPGCQLLWRGRCLALVGANVQSLPKKSLKDFSDLSGRARPPRRGEWSA